MVLLPVGRADVKIHPSRHSFKGACEKKIHLGLLQNEQAVIPVKINNSGTECLALVYMKVLFFVGLREKSANPTSQVSVACARAFMLRCVRPHCWQQFCGQRTIIPTSPLIFI